MGKFKIFYFANPTQTGSSSFDCSIKIIFAENQEQALSKLKPHEKDAALKAIKHGGYWRHCEDCAFEFGEVKLEKNGTVDLYSHLDEYEDDTNVDDEIKELIKDDDEE